MSYEKAVSLITGGGGGSGSGIHWIPVTMNKGLFVLDMSYTDLKEAVDAGELIAFKFSVDEGLYGYTLMYFLTELSFDTDTSKYYAVFAKGSMKAETTPPEVIIDGKVFVASTATDPLSEA